MAEYYADGRKRLMGVSIFRPKTKRFASTMMILNISIRNVQSATSHSRNLRNSRWVRMVWHAGWGLIHYDGTSWQTFNSNDGLLNNTVSCLFESSDGTLWVGSGNSGASSYRDGRWMTYTYTDGLQQGRIEAHWRISPRSYLVLCLSLRIFALSAK